MQDKILDLLRRGETDAALQQARVAVSATPDDAGWPRAGLTVVRFRNQHLQYALTWFGLAVLTLWATWRLLTDERRMRQHGTDAEPSPSLDRHA